MTYWHGSGRIDGNWLTPPSEHGNARVCHGEPFVYLTPTRSLALSYASTTDCPWLYEVEPIGEVEQDPDSLLPPGESVRCERAKILRRFKPSRVEVGSARAAAMMAMDALT
mgnify:CR=1 FL=1